MSTGGSILVSAIVKIEVLITPHPNFNCIGLLEPFLVILVISGREVGNSIGIDITHISISTQPPQPSPSRSPVIPPSYRADIVTLPEDDAFGYESHDHYRQWFGLSE